MNIHITDSPPHLLQRCIDIKKVSEQTTGLVLFWTYSCIRICVGTNDLATSKQGPVYITIQIMGRFGQTE